MDLSQESPGSTLNPKSQYWGKLAGGLLNPASTWGKAVWPYSGGMKFRVKGLGFRADGPEYITYTTIQVGW